METRSGFWRVLTVGSLLFLTGLAFVSAGDQPQWGERNTRNMVSGETGLPTSFDPESGRNIKWSAWLGTETYSTPVVSGGKVLIGTNNNQPRDPRHNGDRGVLMCFNEPDGRLEWQLVVPKLAEDRYLDWPNSGICSPATVEGDRVYIVTNRDEVLCLDLYGLANGNDGPYKDEGRHMAPPDQPAMKTGPLDADIIWLLDLRSTVGVRPHDSTHGSVLIDGRYLYVNTSNGLTSKHDGVEKPDAPSLVVIDKKTGRLVAQDGENIGPRIFHCTWSSPALGEVNGKRLVFFAGGDGVIYGFKALQQTVSSEERVDTLERVLHFDCDPTGPKEDVHRYIRNRNESPSTIMSMPVFKDGKLYVSGGGDMWWGKREAWLKCIDVSKTGDITTTGLLWSYAVENHTCSTPSVSEGLVYVADCGGKVHCVDAKTGQPYWVHNAGRTMWASTLVADDKVFIGTRRGDFWVLAAAKEKRVIDSIRLDAPIHSSAVAANGTLYLGTNTQFFAIQD